jgi:hypothetical protein
VHYDPNTGGLLHLIPQYGTVYAAQGPLYNTVHAVRKTIILMLLTAHQFVRQFPNNIADVEPPPAQQCSSVS